MKIMKAYLKNNSNLKASLDDAVGQYKFYFSTNRISKSASLLKVFQSDFKEKTTKEIKTKFSPRVTSMFIAALYDLSFEVYWIDLLALLEVMAYYECHELLKNYIMPGFVRYVQESFGYLIFSEHIVSVQNQFVFRILREKK